jgi:hypothetical protein
MMKNISKTLLALTVATSLVACGGGGGGGGSSTTPTKPITPPTPATPDLVVTISNTLGDINEKDTGTLSISISGAQGAVTTNTELMGSIEGVTTSESFTATGGDIEIYVDELLNDNEMTLTLSVTDGDNRTESVTQKINLVNTSATIEIEKYTQAMAAIDSFSKMEPETLLFERMTQLAQMLNQGVLITDSSIEDVIDNKLLMQLQTLTSEASSLVSLYNSGSVDEHIFSTRVNEAVVLSDELVAPVNAALKTVISSTSGFAPEIKFAGVIIESGTASQFIGNANLGSYDGSDWVFSSKYSFLTDVVFADKLTCYAE